ncbi:MAG: relaxase/mobilization nuclease domain-containing protein [Rhodomicrobium sp.]|nr:relaxase/mobilization nuclease domain-containing protein [Rhodomicrobium sp.]
MDRAHLHLHIAINKVEPGSFRCIEPYYDKRKLMAACAALEIKHGLARTNHGRSRRARPRGRAADLEAHTAEASFLSWVKEKIEASLLAVVNEGAQWRDVHEILAREGLTLNRRGAGLVVTDAKSGLAIKASAVNRVFSIKELTSRLGPYQPGIPRAEAAPAQTAYGRAPLQRLNTAQLYAAYISQREEGLNARRKARESYAAARKETYATFGKRLKEVRRSGLTREGKRSRRSELRAARALELAALAVKHRDACAAIGDAYLFTWISFLQTRARDGGEEALRALRASGSAGAKTAVDFLTAKDAAAAKTLIFQDLKPVIRRNGEVVYKLADGGTVTDEKLRVRVDKTSYQATFVALTLGAQRFPGQPLAIEGTETFKRQAVEIAAALKLGITFSDSALEDERQRLILNKAASMPPPARFRWLAK